MICFLKNVTTLAQAHCDTLSIIFKTLLDDLRDFVAFHISHASCYFLSFVNQTLTGLSILLHFAKNKLLGFPSLSGSTCLSRPQLGIRKVCPLSTIITFHAGKEGLSGSKGLWPLPHLIQRLIPGAAAPLGLTRWAGVSRSCPMRAPLGLSEA